jgi:hypothetical protein
MPYHIGKKGSSGCSGFPVVDDKGKVMGCHPTKDHAGRQVRALYASGAAEKGMNLMETALSKQSDRTFKRIPEVSDNETTYQGCGCPTCKELNVDCPECPVCGEPMDGILPGISPSKKSEDIISENLKGKTTKSIWDGSFNPNLSK